MSAHSDVHPWVAYGFGFFSGVGFVALTVIAIIWFGTPNLGK